MSVGVVTPAGVELTWVAYVLVGPLFWLGLLAVLVLGRRKLDRLRGYTASLPADAPRVAVLIPARDEATRIEASVRSVLSLQWPADRFEVVVIDDRSVDDTPGVLSRLSAEDARLRVIRIESLPVGWMGKCHALHVAVGRLAAGSAAPDWLLFVDSDVTIDPTALRQTLGLARERGWDALSVLARLEAPTRLERVVLPIAGAAWAGAFSVHRTNEDSQPRHAAANGQFLLVRREAYERVGGHAAVRDQIVEDVALARRLKASGAKIRFISGGHLTRTRMHATWPQMRSGWSRIYGGSAEGRPWRLLAAMAVLIGGWMAWPVLVWASVTLEPHWLAAAVAHVAFVTTATALVYRWAGFSATLAMLWPLAFAAVVRLLAAGVVQVLRPRPIDWRGSAVVIRGQPG